MVGLGGKRGAGLQEEGWLVGGGIVWRTKRAGGEAGQLSEAVAGLSGWVEGERSTSEVGGRGGSYWRALSAHEWGSDTTRMTRVVGSGERAWDVEHAW